MSVGIDHTTLAIALVEAVEECLELSIKTQSGISCPWTECLGKGYRKILSRVINHVLYFNFRRLAARVAIVLGLLVDFAPFLIESLGFHENGVAPGKFPESSFMK